MSLVIYIVSLYYAIVKNGSPPLLPSCVSLGLEASARLIIDGFRVDPITLRFSGGNGKLEKKTYNDVA